MTIDKDKKQQAKTVQQTELSKGFIQDQNIIFTCTDMELSLILEIIQKQKIKFLNRSRYFCTDPWDN